MDEVDQLGDDNKMIDKVKEKLKGSGYEEKAAQSLAERLAASEVIREQLLKWVENNEETDCRYEEFSVFALMRERRFTYPNALNTIAWLHNAPDIARKALTSGVDRIVKGER